MDGWMDKGREVLINNKEFNDELMKNAGRVDGQMNDNNDEWIINA